jgi:hypothetical protein
MRLDDLYTIGRTQLDSKMRFGAMGRIEVIRHIFSAVQMISKNKTVWDLGAVGRGGASIQNRSILGILKIVIVFHYNLSGRKSRTRQAPGNNLPSYPDR